MTGEVCVVVVLVVVSVAVCVWWSGMLAVAGTAGDALLPLDGENMPVA